jgi:hypothetical protein
MLVASKVSWNTRCVLVGLLLAAVALGVVIGQRMNVAAGPSVQLMDDWDIPQLVAYLNGKGLGVHLVSTQKDGVDPNTAFLTTTDQEWGEFNRLANDPKQIAQWKGTLYCERGPHLAAWSDQIRHWGNCCVIVGPFLLYGDPELLGKVCAALATRH